ncbi:acyl-CoA carboxylase epsilon subunit [Pseudofrankia inefficax]|uniref:Acyl-CoA carboxylase epsilon subunit n=1 Tax=Pseudofrankia inefficax (strain DSM 45817 / CECT 9037 / DDB 130130 / EuI1c) TaxID=298654 RepID=E3J3R4_PSEI1|nr:hypothetical protein FraEuI1c_1334 [Pseudofrankia inefficax]
MSGPGPGAEKGRASDPPGPDIRVTRGRADERELAALTVVLAMLVRSRTGASASDQAGATAVPGWRPAEMGGWTAAGSWADAPPPGVRHPRVA